MEQLTWLTPPGSGQGAWGAAGVGFGAMEQLAWLAPPQAQAREHGVQEGWALTTHMMEQKEPELGNPVPAKALLTGPSVSQLQSQATWARWLPWAL